MQKQDQETCLDHTISVVLPQCFPTLNASYHSQGSSQSNAERIQRFHGTSIIHDALTKILAKLKIHSDSEEDELVTMTLDEDSYQGIYRDVSCTACVLFHRFFHAPCGSIYEMDVWSLSMASLLLATKIHDLSLISVRSIIQAFCSIYRERILGGNLSTLKDVAQEQRSVALPPIVWNRLSKEEQRRRLDQTISLPTHGPVYLEWYNAIASAECRLLQQLGYIVFWIPDHHAHKFVESFCHQVGIAVDLDRNRDESSWDLCERQQKLIHEAYQYCRKASHIDLCVRYTPEVICCAIMQCAALQLHFELQSGSKGGKGLARYWWVDLWKVDTNEFETIEKDINSIVTAINSVEGGLDFTIASHSYIPSKLPNNGSFSDPNSFVWEMIIERLASDS